MLLLRHFLFLSFFIKRIFAKTAERRLAPNMAGRRVIRKFQTYPSRGFSRGSENAYLTSPISPIFLHVTNLQRRAGRLFETARLRQTKSSLILNYAVAEDHVG